MLCLSILLQLYYISELTAAVTCSNITQILDKHAGAVLDPCFLSFLLLIISDSFYDPYKRPERDNGNHWTKLPEIVKFISANSNSNIPGATDTNEPFGKHTFTVMFINV